MAKNLETSLNELKDKLEIVKLNIICHTNKDTLNTLTANMFVFDNGETIKGEYPLLCTNVEYNLEYFEQKPLKEKVQIFFAKPEFEKFLLSSLKLADKPTPELVRKNILAMLNIIFPITFPIKDRVQSMFKNTFEFDWNSAYEAVKQPDDYVILNVDKPSTVTEVIWLDTLITNPIYVQLYETIKTYKRKLTEYMEDIEKSAKQKYSISYYEQNIIKPLEEMKKEVVGSYYSRRSVSDSDFENFNKSVKNLRSKSQEISDDNPMTKEFQELIDSVIKVFDNKKINTDETKNQFEKITQQLRINSIEGQDKVELRKILSTYNKEGDQGDNTMQKRFSDYDVAKRSSFWWKLYFIFARLKKNTVQYNNFVERYIDTHVFQVKPDRYNYNYWNTNSESLKESKFLKSLGDLEFHFDFLKKVEPFISQRRKSTNPIIASMFREDQENYVTQIDKYLTLFRNKKENTNASVDIIKQSSSTSQNDLDLDEVKQKGPKDKTEFFEIHLGVALVGGKVSSTNKEYCMFQALKLGVDFKKITKYNPTELILYPYVDFGENAEQPKNLPTIMNLNKKGGGGGGGGEKRKLRASRSRARSYALWSRSYALWSRSYALKKSRRTRKLFNRNFQEKKPKNN